MNKSINIKKLRQDLIDYFGTAMSSGFPMAVIDITKIERASDEELISIANKIGINIRKYIDDVER